MIIYSALFEPDAGAAYSFEIVQSYFYQSKKFQYWCEGNRHVPTGRQELYRNCSSQLVFWSCLYYTRPSQMTSLATVTLPRPAVKVFHLHGSYEWEEKVFWRRISWRWFLAVLHSAANQCQINLKTHRGFLGGPAKYLHWSRFSFRVCKSSCKWPFRGGFGSEDMHQCPWPHKTTLRFLQWKCDSCALSQSSGEQKSSF